VGGRRGARPAAGAALRRLLLLAAIALAASPAARAADWTGTFRLPASAEPVDVSVELHARTAVVTLAPGHGRRVVVPVTRSGGRVRFALPGLPTDVVFAGRAGGGALAGTVSQGRLRGSFLLVPGRSRVLPALGVYRGPDGTGVAIVQAEGLPTWLVELPSGDVHGLDASLTTVGRRLGDTSGAGTLAVRPESLTWTHDGRAATYRRVALRQREVRVGADAATLTLPPGRGPFPAVAMVHGSGPQTREEFQVFAAYCALLGIAVLADDKRGGGQSGGVYPGERATPPTVDVLARDAQAEARFLASLPQVDPRRVGLVGDSQAGWIIPSPPHGSARCASPCRSSGRR
jgi:hypothetical protein